MIFVNKSQKRKSSFPYGGCFVKIRVISGITALSSILAHYCVSETKQVNFWNTERSRVYSYTFDLLSGSLWISASLEYNSSSLSWKRPWRPGSQWCSSLWNLLSNVYLQWRLSQYIRRRNALIIYLAFQKPYCNLTGLVLNYCSLQSYCPLWGQFVRISCHDQKSVISCILHKFVLKVFEFVLWATKWGVHTVEAYTSHLTQENRALGFPEQRCSCKSNWPHVQTNPQSRHALYRCPCIAPTGWWNSRSRTVWAKRSCVASRWYDIVKNQA